MAVFETELMAELAREVGDTDSSNLYYTANEIFSALNDGLKDYNRCMPIQFEVIGSGNSAYYNPDPNEEQKRLIVLFSSKVLLKGEMAKQARQAVIHTNPTGRTDLSKRPEWTLAALKQKDQEIKELKRMIEQRLVNDEIHSGKGSSELKSNTTGESPEGLSSIVITEVK